MSLLGLNKCEKCWDRIQEDGSCGCHNNRYRAPVRYVPVVQKEERPSPKGKVVGSNPTGNATKKYVNIKAVASNTEDLKSLVRVLGYIQKAGQMGAGTTIKLFVDGDGSADYRFLVNGEELDCSELKDLNDIPVIWLGE